MQRLFLLFLPVLLGPSSESEANDSLKIVDRPIKMDRERRRLTIEYRRTHQGASHNSIEIEPRVIVLHHTGTATLEAAWVYFNRTRIESGRKISKAGRVNVSAHFLVDRDGTIYRLMPEIWMARHCIGLNHLAIAVENVGGSKRHPLTKAQEKANAALVRHLADRFPITHLIGHHEYRQMESHRYFWEKDPNYRSFKVDPGPSFMKNVRSRLRDLQIEGPDSTHTRP